MSTVEKRVQRDLAEVAAIEEAMKAQASGGSTPEAQSTEVTADPTKGAAEPANTDETAPVAKPAASEQASSPVKDETDKDADYWKSRFHTVQGLLNSQSSQIKESAARIKALTEEIEALKKAASEKPAPAEVSAISDKDKEEFGEELIDLQRRVVNEAVAPLQKKIAQLEEENSTLKGQVGQTGSQIASMTFEGRLNALVPDFEDINSDPSWIKWLDEVDPMLGAPRRSAAQDAFERGDADAVARFVGVWKSSNKKAETEKPKDTLQTQVTPARGAATGQQPAETAKVYTEKEADSLWEKVRDLNRRGKNEEANKLEAELTDAYVQGRIVVRA